jgi:ferredoxin
MQGFDSLKEMLDAKTARRKVDMEKYETIDDDLCMLCGAYGADKRNLVMRCFYDIKEVLPEALDLSKHPDVKAFFIRICKSCRARFLGHLSDWRKECLALRDVEKDHDGGVWADEGYDLPETERNIPVRVHGATTMMNLKEYEAYRKQHE